MSSILNQFEDRCVGTMLGLACGDALGAPAEFKTAGQVAEKFGVLRDFHSFGKKPWPAGSYTDDTEMAIGLAESLIYQQKVDPVYIGQIHAKYCLTEPCRGYGKNTRCKMQRIQNGESPLETGDLADSNGAVMRIAPLGLAIRNMEPEQRHADAVNDAICCTHKSVDARGAAGLLTTIVGYLATGGHEHIMRDTLKRKAQLLTNVTDGLLSRLKWLYIDGGIFIENDTYALDALVKPNPDASLGRHFAIRAVDCLALALWCFHHHPEDPERAVIRAANMGGDADTVAAVTGAMCGALHGAAWIPDRWLSILEGREKLTQLGIELARLDIR